MFAVHDINGVQFRGTLEELERQRFSVQRRPPVKGISEENRNNSQDEKPSDQPANFTRKGLATYMQMLSRNDMVEPLIHIEQIMSSPVASIVEDSPISSAWKRLRDGKLRQLAVVNAANHLVGLISDRDILRHINIIGDAVEISRDAPVREVMPVETVTCQAMSDIRRVARVMAFSHLDAMVVLDEEEMVGIVTRGDILRGFAEHPKLNLWA